MVKKVVFFIFSFALIMVNFVSAQMIITYRSPESKNDKRYEYDNQLLKLSLDKTKKKYGDYKLVPSQVMNYSRAMKKLERNSYPNFMAKYSYEERFVEKMNLAYIKFPVDLGIVGYRVFFVSKKIKKKFSIVRTIDDLKKFTVGQGTGWADVEILRSSGFSVQEIPKYESLFYMVAANRFDLFPRGTNELLNEYEAHKGIKNFTYDTSLCLAYPLPRFFYTHKSNQKAIRRITEGLLMAFEDGSVEKLWHKKYKDSIEFVNLEKRRILWVENPNVKSINFDYKKYFYKP